MIYVRRGIDPEPSRLMAAINAGAGVMVQADRESGSVSLGFLAPVIDRVEVVEVEGTALFVDTEWLSRAVSLQELGWRARRSTELSVAELPRLRKYDGVITSKTRSVVLNPNLADLWVHGNLPAGLRIDAPVEVFTHVGASTQSQLPEFAKATVRELSRDGAKHFDLAQLLAFPHLRKFRIDNGAVTGLHHLQALTELQSVFFNGTTAVDGWSGLPSIEQGRLYEIHPEIDESTRERLSSAGDWSLPIAPSPRSLDSADFLALPIPDDGEFDGWTWTVESAPGVVPLESPDGDPLPAEASNELIEAVADQLGVACLADSEGSQLFAYFRDREAAEAVAAVLNAPALETRL